MNTFSEIVIEINIEITIEITINNFVSSNFKI